MRTVTRTIETLPVTIFPHHSQIDLVATAVSQAIGIALVGKSLYEGQGGLVGAGHIVGTLGWGVMNSPGVISGGVIYGVEGKVDNQAGRLTSGVAVEGQFSFQAAGLTTDQFVGCNANLPLPGNLGTIGNFIGFGCAAPGNAGTITNYIGLQVATAAGTVSNAFGVFITDQTAVGLNVGVFCQMAAGAAKYGLLLDGTARNVLKGRTHFGADVDTGMFLGTEDGIALKDGVAEPATLAGYAKLFVDSVSGDLKIKFGDGVVKTIVVDT